MNNEIDEAYRKIRLIVLREFSDIAELTEQIYGKLRVHLIDESYLDIWLSRKFLGASPITGNIGI